MDSLEFADQYINALRADCANQLNQNLPPVDTTADESTFDADPFPDISNELCPANCNGKGTCAAG